MLSGAPQNPTEKDELGGERRGREPIETLIHLDCHDLGLVERVVQLQLGYDRRPFAPSRV